MNCRVSDIDFKNTFPNRAGIIMYTQYKNEIYFGLGRDCISHELTDFGGTARYQKNNIKYSDKDVISAAMREFHEETLGIFEEFDRSELNNSLCVFDKHTFIIFMHVNLDPDEISSRFNSRCKEIIDSNPDELRRLEVCGITWLSISQFARALYSSKEKYKTGILYYRVEKLLRRAKNFINEL